jgi:Dynamin family
VCRLDRRGRRQDRVFNPTELVLRRATTLGVKVSINPGSERSTDERERISRFHIEIDDVNPDLGSIVDKAKETMGLSDTKVFSTVTLRVELCGPTQSHLTMVDLPGLFRAGNRDQSVEDSATIRKMVRGYMKRPRSIILAVVSAKSDFAFQEVTEFARELDPKGTRTLGLITKPDTLDAGSNSEASYFRLAQNEDVVFRLGWHVLKNRSYKMREANRMRGAPAPQTSQRYRSGGHVKAPATPGD